MRQSGSFILLFVSYFLRLKPFLASRFIKAVTDGWGNIGYRKEKKVDFFGEILTCKGDLASESCLGLLRMKTTTALAMVVCGAPRLNFFV